MMKILNFSIILSLITSYPSHSHDGSLAINEINYKVDKFGRILSSEGRKAMPCPNQTPDTAVFLITGQSNAANYGETLFKTSYPAKVLNFFQGKCFSAASPLIGADGKAGESWTILADKLIETGKFDQVILLSSGIGATAIERWQQGGDLNLMLLKAVKSAQRKYRITHVLWHQGEADLVRKTSTEAYVTRFESFARSLRKVNVRAPIYVSITSKCIHPEGWKSDDAVTIAQRQLVNPSEGIFAGPNTNDLVLPGDRYDKCHFANSGQLKFADEWLRILNDDRR
ncbi:MAG: hypothetical protein IBJ12_16105 [Sphingomonadaceae bacterium]|nr:hypothetical protein [Sphingomonadaceae bacterium]